MSKTTHNTTTDQRPTCCECGGHNVETTAWIEYTADGIEHVVNTEGPIGDESGNWCHDCDAHVDLDYPATTPADDARRQAANAARQHAGEMLDLLRALTTGDAGETLETFDPAVHAATVARARELIHLLAY